MRQITIESVEAFVNDFQLSKQNMTINIGTPLDTQVMKLHGNEIARIEGNLLTITDAGWQTNTTKERLNGILDYYGLWFIKQEAWTWYHYDGTNKLQFEGEQIFKIK